MRTVILIILLINLCSCSTRREQIRQFVAGELKYYPQSRLTDLYKNYFQDAFGPGHLIPDTASAAAYLDWELQQTDYSDTVKFQELGIRHDFIRINLDLVRKGLVPRNVMLDAMVKSAALARKPDIKEWKNEWHRTVAIIKKIEPELEGFQVDSLKIEEMLAKGETAMHHSPQFTDAYHPHYRIIHRTILDTWKKSYLKGETGY